MNSTNCTYMKIQIYTYIHTFLLRAMFSFCDKGCFNYKLPFVIDSISNNVYDVSQLCLGIFCIFIFRRQTTIVFYKGVLSESDIFRAIQAIIGCWIGSGWVILGFDHLTFEPIESIINFLSQNWVENKILNWQKKSFLLLD